MPILLRRASRERHRACRAIALVAPSLVMLVPGVNKNQSHESFSPEESAHTRALHAERLGLLLTVDSGVEVLAYQLRMTGARNLFVFSSLPLQATEDLLRTHFDDPENGSSGSS